MNRHLYTLLLYCLLPFIPLRLLWRSRKAPAYRSRLAERFGLGLPPLQQGGIWIHAVSVGESIAAVPLVKALRKQYPEQPITVTCMTPTGSERIQALLGDQVQHCYMPYDYPWAARRFLQALQPKLAVIMETELWPNHIHACAERGIPVVLANARLSERSARGYARFAGLTRPMLQELSAIAVQTEVEAERFRQLGADPERITVTGSIKFDLEIPPELPEQARALRKSWGAEQRPVWIAASTHAGEEEIILDAHRMLLEQKPDALLILVPRHPERFKAVAGLCQKAGFSHVLRSRNIPVTSGVQVLLGDTMGELLFLYALADVAFVGGSLVPRGGHNMLEPALLGLPVITGPFVFNFVNVAGSLVEQARLCILESNGALINSLFDSFSRGALAGATFDRGNKSAGQGGLEPLLVVVSEYMGS